MPNGDGLSMHPFAQYIQILGKGRNGMRSLSEQEAYDAMKMICCYDVEAEQLGAFLMLMRVKEETAAEVAGFTRALRESLPLDNLTYTPVIDWAAYAGKKRHYPWFILSALTLTRQGYPVFMHGLRRDDERIYVPQALKALGIPLAESLLEAEKQLQQSGFSYLSIENLSPLISQLIATRELFGLRSPLHTVSRMLNPFHAELTVAGVFHPNFSPIHQQASLMLQQPRALFCKGEGGEFERIPERPVELYGVSDQQSWQESWDKTLQPGLEVKPEKMDLSHWVSVWQGTASDLYGEYAVIGTLAWCIRALGIELQTEAAENLASVWWQSRHDGQ
ncbi:MAG: glycosyl transferase family protein [gamma proteobacterium symbiont of Phacoides pectinatus]